MTKKEMRETVEYMRLNSIQISESGNYYLVAPWETVKANMITMFGMTDKECEDFKKAIDGT